MNIPDQAVYGLLPIIAGVGLWIGRQFVKENRRRTTEQRREVDPKPTPDLDLLGRLNVREYRQVVACIEEVFNGRYMLAEEAREEFHKIELGMESINGKLSGLQEYNSRTD